MPLCGYCWLTDILVTFVVLLLSRYFRLRSMWWMRQSITCLLSTTAVYCIIVLCKLKQASSMLQK